MASTGPALGFVNSSVKRMNWGLFAQTFFSYAGDDDASNVGLVVGRAGRRGFAGSKNVTGTFQ